MPAYKVMIDVKVYSDDSKDTQGKSHVIAVEVDAASHEQAAATVVSALQQLVDITADGNTLVAVPEAEEEEEAAPRRGR